MMMIYVYMLTSLCIYTSTYSANKIEKNNNKNHKPPAAIKSVSPKKNNSTLCQSKKIEPKVVKKAEPKVPSKKITNCITNNDLGYYKMLSWHYPDTFTITVNNQAIASGQTIELNNPTVTIIYTYEWTTPWGKQAGTKETTYEIPHDINTVNITFNGWEEEERIAVSDSKKVSAEKLIEHI